MTTTMRNSLCAMTMTMTIMKMAKAKISCSLLLLLTMTTVVKNVAVTVADAAPLNDLIIELPDYGRPPTPHFSGYLDASAGCDTDINGPICKIHYWLALAAEEEEDDDADSKSATTATKPTGKFAYYVIFSSIVILVCSLCILIKIKLCLSLLPDFHFQFLIHILILIHSSRIRMKLLLQ